MAKRKSNEQQAKSLQIAQWKDENFVDGIKDGESNCDNDGDAGADEVDEEVGSEINFECVGGGEVEWLMLFGGFASWQTDMALVIVELLLLLKTIVFVRKLIESFVVPVVFREFLDFIFYI